MDSTRHDKALQVDGLDLRISSKSFPGENTIQDTSTSKTVSGNHSDTMQATTCAMVATSSGLQKKISKCRVPNRRAKRLSAYTMFFREKYAEAKQQARQANPSSGFGEIAKIVGALWASYSENEKNYYRRRILEEKLEILKASEAPIDTPGIETTIDSRFDDVRKQAFKETLGPSTTSVEGNKYCTSVPLDL